MNPYTDFETFLLLTLEPELKFVISNTTEAGIAHDENDTLDMAPPNSFPANLTVFLYERFKHFKGDYAKALTIIPCELINSTGIPHYGVGLAIKTNSFFYSSSTIYRAMYITSVPI